MERKRSYKAGSSAAAALAVSLITGSLSVAGLAVATPGAAFASDAATTTVTPSPSVAFTGGYGPHGPQISTGSTVVFRYGTITVSGLNFKAGEEVDLTALSFGHTLRLGHVVATTANTFEATFPIPSDAATGQFEIVAVGNMGQHASTTVLVQISIPPLLNGLDGAVGAVGKVLSQQIGSVGIPTPTYSETGALPGGVSLSSSGLLSGTPVAGSQGTYPLTVTASSPAGTTSKAFVVRIYPSTRFPRWTGGYEGVANVGQSFTYQVTAGGYPAPTYTISGGNLPRGLTFNTSGLLSGTPAAGTGGTYKLTLAATNPAGTAKQAFTLTVKDRPSAPKIYSAAAATATQGSYIRFQVLAKGYPAPTFSASGVPSGLSFSSGGVLTGRPAKSGTYAISITASSSAGSAKQTLTLTVGREDVHPFIRSGPKPRATINRLFEFQVRAIGYPAPTFAITGTLPTGISFSPTGLISGIPPADAAGVYHVTVTASNTVGQSVQSMTITVGLHPPRKGLLSFLGL